jgi:hypothetical protein
MRDKSIDFNSILTGANLLVAGLVVFAFMRTGANEYVDQETMLLGVALAVQTQIALWFERRRRDPFIILLAFSVTFYYVFRLFTLILYPYSLVFERYSYNAGDSNYALIFIIAANVFLYAGFYVVRFRDNRVINSGQWRATSPVRVIFLMLAAILFAYTSGIFWTEDNIPRVFNFLVIFLSQNIILLMAMSYYFLFEKSISRKIGLTIAILIILEMAAHTLLGSRGAIVGIVQSYMLASLAIAGSIWFSRKYFVLGVVLFPVVVGLLVGSFAISTYNRANRANRDSATSLDLGRTIELAAESSSALSVGQALDVVVPALAARAGFFDFSAEIIAHRDEYASVINLSSYAKSIVDNLLTPGFDVYDQPKISNALQFVYEDLGSPSKVQVAEGYQSDQLGIYGEFYALFGYASLPFLFLFAFWLKRVYVKLSNANLFIRAMHRVVVLFVFVRMIDSFGIDWTIGETLPLLVATYIYRFFFTSKRASTGDAPPSADFGHANAIGQIALPY